MTDGTQPVIKKVENTIQPNVADNNGQLYRTLDDEDLLPGQKLDLLDDEENIIKLNEQKKTIKHNADPKPTFIDRKNSKLKHKKN